MLERSELGVQKEQQPFVLCLGPFGKEHLCNGCGRDGIVVEDS